MPPELQAQIDAAAASAQLEAVAVSLHDFESGTAISREGDRWFHAASTFKVALLLALLKAVQAGEVRLVDHLQIRNRFLSLTTGEPFRVARDRDGDSSVHAALGRSLTLQQLARAMIIRSSNLATNLLLDFLTLDRVQAALAASGVEGVEIRRGVEDLAAHEAGVNNEVTADGLLQLFRCFIEGGLSEENRALGLEILHAQEFNRMIPARLPKGVRVAHKTGEISTHCHDAGLVFPPGRRPYALVVLTESKRETEGRPRAIADISLAVYRHLIS